MIPGKLYPLATGTELFPGSYNDRRSHWTRFEKGAVFMFVLRCQDDGWSYRYTFLGPDGMLYQLTWFGVGGVFGLYESD
jgi:hypothetical protein